MDSGAVADGLINGGVPRVLVKEMMEGYSECKRRFYLSDYRPNAVEGARFAEAVFRICQWATQPNNEYTPIGKTLPKVDQLLVKMLNGTGDVSLRKNIPRNLQIIYTIRNDRDVAHLGADIDPNLMDATVVVALMNWVLAELVRLYHSVDADAAQKAIDQIVTREVPAVQLIREVPRVLRELRASEHCLVLLFQAGSNGITFTDLRNWVRPKMRANLRRTLRDLIGEDKVHQDGDTYFILIPGERHVEENKLLEPSSSATKGPK